MFEKKNYVDQFLFPLVTLYQDNLTDLSISNKSFTFLLFWNKESLGFLVSNRPFFKIIKEHIPNAKIILLVNKNMLKFSLTPKIYDLLGLKEEDEILTIKGLNKIKNNEFDVAISPSLQKFSFINHLFLRFIKAKRKIGFAKINDNPNPYTFSLNSSVNFNWKDNPDIHFSEILINLLLPLGFQLKNKSPNLNFYNLSDIQKREVFNSFNINHDTKLVGINYNSDNLLSKWDSENVVRLIELFNNSGEYLFYFVGTGIENNIQLLLKKTQKLIPLLNKKKYLELIYVIAASSLFITCDSELMHLAGSTNVPQISLFGNRNPFNWAPLGKDKLFISKSYGVNDIGSEEVFDLSINLMNREK